MKDRNKPINDYCKISTLIKGRVLVNGAVVVQTAAGKWVDKPFGRLQLAHTPFKRMVRGVLQATARGLGIRIALLAQTK